MRDGYAAEVLANSEGNYCCTFVAVTVVGFYAGILIMFTEAVELSGILIAGCCCCGFELGGTTVCCCWKSGSFIIEPPPALTSGCCGAGYDDVIVSVFVEFAAT